MFCNDSSININCEIFRIENEDHEVYRENIDAQVASTDGRATLYANGQANMFERKKGVFKKQRGGFKYKKTKPSIFSFPT